MKSSIFRSLHHLFYSSSLLLLLAPACFAANACGSDDFGQCSIFTQSHNLPSVTGVRFNQDQCVTGPSATTASSGYLYAASIIGNQITALDPSTGNIIKRITGTSSPDDFAFDAAGNLYWASMSTGAIGKVTPFLNSASIVIPPSAMGPGVDGIAVNEDKTKLYVGQYVEGNGLFEVQLDNNYAIRNIVANSGNLAAGYNASSWSNGKLYSPIPLMGIVVTTVLDEGPLKGTWNVVAGGFSAGDGDQPLSVKFDSQCNMDILVFNDNGNSRVVRVKPDFSNGLTPDLVANVPGNVDNMAVDNQGNIFVSSIADGSIRKIPANYLPGIVPISFLVPPGMVAPGSLAITSSGLVVGDGGPSMKTFDLATGSMIQEDYASYSGNPARYVYGAVISPDPSSPTSIFLSASSVAPEVVSWDTNLHVVTGVDYLPPSGSIPLYATRSQGTLVVALYQKDASGNPVPGAGQVVKVDIAGNATPIATGLTLPVALAADPSGQAVYISDGATGNVIRTDLNGTQVTFATGLNEPNGLVIDPSHRYLVVAEAGSGTLTAINLTTNAKFIAMKNLGKTVNATSIMKGLALDAAGNYYVSDTDNRSIDKVTLNLP